MYEKVKNSFAKWVDRFAGHTRWLSFAVIAAALVFLAACSERQRPQSVYRVKLDAVVGQPWLLMTRRPSRDALPGLWIEWAVWESGVFVKGIVDGEGVRSYQIGQIEPHVASLFRETVIRSLCCAPPETSKFPVHDQSISELTVRVDSRLSQFSTPHWHGSAALAVPTPGGVVIAENAEERDQLCASLPPGFVEELSFWWSIHKLLVAIEPITWRRATPGEVQLQELDTDR